MVILSCVSSIYTDCVDNDKVNRYSENTAQVIYAWDMKIRSILNTFANSNL